MRTYFYFLVLVAAALPTVAGCASAAPKGSGQFIKLAGAPVEKTLFNQVHGQVTSRIQPVSSLAIDDYCLFRYTEEFLDGEGKRVRGMGQDTRKSFLFASQSSGCTVLTQPFIKIFDLDVASFQSHKSLIDAFLRGSYDGGANPALDALLKAGTSPSSISHKNQSSYSFMFATSSGFGEAVVSLDQDSQKPTLLSFSEWQ